MKNATDINESILKALPVIGKDIKVLQRGLSTVERKKILAKCGE